MKKISLLRRMIILFFCPEALTDSTSSSDFRARIERIEPVSKKLDSSIRVIFAECVEANELMTGGDQIQVLADFDFRSNLSNPIP